VTEPPDFSALYAVQYDLFLSCSWSDDADARALYGDLSGAMAVFFAPVDLPPEVQRQARFQFASLLMEALTRSAHFVALLSPRYLESAWCRLEMQGFANMHRRDAARRHQQGQARFGHRRLWGIPRPWRDSPFLSPIGFAHHWCLDRKTIQDFLDFFRESGRLSPSA
jgi:hypothetical protein